MYRHLRQAKKKPVLQITIDDSSDKDEEDDDDRHINNNNKMHVDYKNNDDDKYYFNRIYKESIIKNLRGYREKLHDISILNLLYLLAEIKGKNKEELIIVDSLALTQFMKNNLSKEKRIKLNNNLSNIVKMNIRDNNTIILFPIHDSVHWSLLVFIKRINEWFHFDSVMGCHKEYVIKVIKNLKMNNIYNSKKIYINTLKHNNPYSEQKGKWECGLFLLMNAFLMININNKLISKNNDYLFLYIEENIKFITNKYRPIFTEKLITILNEL